MLLGNNLVTVAPGYNSVAVALKILVTMAVLSMLVIGRAVDVCWTVPDGSITECDDSDAVAKVVARVATVEVSMVVAMVVSLVVSMGNVKLLEGDNTAVEASMLVAIVVSMVVSMGNVKLLEGNTNRGVDTILLR